MKFYCYFCHKLTPAAGEQIAISPMSETVYWCGKCEPGKVKIPRSETPQPQPTAPHWGFQFYGGIPNFTGITYNKPLTDYLVLQ